MTVADLWLPARTALGRRVRPEFARRPVEPRSRPEARRPDRRSRGVRSVPPTVGSPDDRLRRRGVHAATRPTSSGGTSPTSTGPVFALVNLPEVVKGALFARYSRSPKSLRRLFLDEFVGELDITGDTTIDATVGPAPGRGALRPGVLRVRRRLRGPARRRPPGLRAGVEPADQGARVGPAHGLPRAVDPLHRLRHPHRRPLPLLPRPRGARLAARHPLRRRHGPAVRHLRRAACRSLQDFFREQFPKDPDDSDFVYRQAIRAKAFDALRGILPAASLSNVGIYGTGQGYEQLLLRMRAHPLPEARAYADLMLTELRKVIPSFLKRVDLDDRGVAWSTYLARQPRRPWTSWPSELFPRRTPSRRRRRRCTLVDFDPDGEVKLVAADALPAHPRRPRTRSSARVRAMSADERLAVVRAYVGDRTNRRHKPGRALERIDYRFDVLADYGAFRDLQRHRMLTIEWQRAQPAPRLHPARGGRRSPARPAASTRRWSGRPRSTTLLETASRPRRPTPCRLAYKVRFVHADERPRGDAPHRAAHRRPQGHPAYRVVGQEMHRLIAEEAGHHAVAEMMRYVDHSPEPSLERLDAERRAESRRQSS